MYLVRNDDSLIVPEEVKKWTEIVHVAVIVSVIIEEVIDDETNQPEAADSL